MNFAVYTKDGCPYCDKVKEVLQLTESKFVVYNLDQHFDKDAFHGEFGKGTWTFYGGHDPEDYKHRIGDPKTELALYPNSPGYRLILNNILFPAAKKKKRKT